MFGHSSSSLVFNMFKSESNPNLIFKDSTKCLQEVPSGKNYTQFLGREYITTIDSLRECASSQTGRSPQPSRMSDTTADSLHGSDPNCHSSAFCSFPLQNWRRRVPSTPARRSSEYSGVSQTFCPAVTSEADCRPLSHLFTENLFFCNPKISVLLLLFSKYFHKTISPLTLRMQAEPGGGVSVAKSRA